MLKTKSLITSINEVPREWVFEYYLKLSEKLTGQDVRIKSIFNPADQKPSFFVYYSLHKKRYYFKDFSTDDHGDGTHLVMLMFKLKNRGEAAHKIIEDYIEHGESYKASEVKAQTKFKVTAYSLRQWTVIDRKYWTEYHIGSKLLSFFNVRPLKSYTMTKEDDAEAIVEVSHNRIYGFFKKDGTLYKVYQPYSNENKFIKVENYTQGTDQLTFEKPYLVICSSVKDMMAFHTLGFTNAETIAPDSENSLIPDIMVEAYQKRYKTIVTLFDTDDAGIRAMEKWNKKHHIQGVCLKMSKAKDLADCVKIHGIDKTRAQLYPLLTKALTGKAKQL